MIVTATDALDAARTALAGGNWADARREFEAALQVEDSPEGLEGLGLACFWLDDAEVTISAREQAYLVYRERGDDLGAGRVATLLAWDYNAFRGEAAVANGWLQRAHRLLDVLAPCVEQGWLALREASNILPAEPARAQELTAHALELGRRLGDLELEMVALALDGLVRVSRGEVAQGMKQLDEASAAAVGGDLRDPNAIGFSCCYLIFACERTQDLERAAQWSDRLSELCRQWGIRPLFAVCRTHYANVLILRGHWQEAEAELVPASEEFLATRPPGAVEAFVRLGELRRRQGRLEEAEELFTRSEPHPLAHLGHAAVALDRDDAERAADGAERYLRLFEGELRVEHASGLELLVKASVRLGQRERAEESAAQLSALARAVGSAPLAGAAALANGLAADQDSARAWFEAAADHYASSRLPFEEAHARLGLSRALGAEGKREAALREAQRALGQLRDLGAATLRAELLVNELGGRRRGDGSLTKRELDVLRLVSEGLSDGEIADRLVLSEHTVHRHIANVRAKLGVSSRAAAAAQAARAGLL